MFGMVSGFQRQGSGAGQDGNRKKPAREAALYGVLGALLIVVQVALAPLPNVELVSLLVMVYSVTIGYKALLPVYLFVLVEGLLYGFGLWFVNYCYVWAVLVLVAYALRRHTGVIVWCLVSAFFGLGFGALCALPYFFIGGPASAFAYWLSGIPFDVIHCLGNGLVAALLFRPLRRCMEKLLHYSGIF